MNTQTPDAVHLLPSDVAIFSILFALGAGIVFALVAHFSQRPIRTYLIVSSIVLILSLALPFKAPTLPVTLFTKLTLAAMHIIGAIAVEGGADRTGQAKDGINHFVREGDSIL